MSGACGTVVFTGSIGSDSASAFRTIEMSKRQRHGAGASKLDLSPLVVVDSNGEAPSPRFYAVHVLDAEGELHLESVSEAMTTGGDHYGVTWCDD